MKTRIISSVVIIAPMLVFVLLGGIPLLVFCLALSVVGMYEFYKGYRNEGVNPGMIWAFAMVVALYVILFFGEFTDLAPQTYTHLLQMWVFGTVFLGLIMTLYRKDHNVLDGPITSLGLLYIGYFFAHLVLINSIGKFHLMVWLVFIAAFGQDTCAYFSGYFFGKHKMAPQISPKKTWEGAIGGIIGATFLCGIFGLIFYRKEFLHCLLIGFFGAFFGMAGDLIASAFKRKIGIKDYGNLIPGHGGILDRFDSVLLVSPFVYYYILLFIRP